MKYLILLIVVVFSQRCFATTWVEVKVADPLHKGAKCKVQEPASYGSYIYHYPSKYDQVFWPYTDANSIWFCKKSGFIAFMPDFKEVSEDEKKTIKAYLKENKLKKPSTLELIQRLEKLYEYRDIDPKYRNKLIRVFARWYQGFGDLKKATEYRKIAFSEIEAFLKTDLEPFERLEYLYLAANYARLFGEIDKSDAYLVTLEKTIEAIIDPEVDGYKEYIADLMKETQFIEPGQRVEPVLPSKK